MHALTVHAHDQVVRRAAARVHRAEVILTDVETKVEVATTRRASRRRSRSGRSQRVEERSAEERALETRCQVWADLVGSARAAHQVADHCAEVARAADREYRKARPLTAEALDACRTSFRRAVATATKPDAAATLANVRAAAAAYRHAAKLIRERREPLLLAQAYKDEGDLHLAANDVEAAGIAWHEGIDALFSARNAASSWRAVLGGGVIDPAGPAASAWLHATLGLIGCLVGGTLLGRIARHVCRDNFDARLERARFAACMFRAAFAATLPHPGTHLMRPGGQRCLPGVDAAFARYEPSLLGALPTPLFGAPRRLAPRALASAVVTTIGALVRADRAPAALPLACLLEHIAISHRFDVRMTALARVTRLGALIGAGLVAEAASVLAALLRGANLPEVDGAYVGYATREPMRTSSADAGDPPPASGTLPFCGFASWNAALPPDAAENTAATTWLAGWGSCGDEDAESTTTMFRRAGDAEGVAGIALAARLPRGCAGLHSLNLVAAYGANVLVALSLARAELLLALAVGAGEVGPGASLRETVDAIATEVQTTMVEAQSGSEGVGSDSWARVRDTSRCLDLRARCALASNRPATAHCHAAMLLALLQRQCRSSDGATRAHMPDAAAYDVDASFWAAGRAYLAQCALLQRRLDNAMVHCELGTAEADVVRDACGARDLASVAIDAAVRRGNDATTTLAAAEALINTHDCVDVPHRSYVRALVGAAGLQRCAALAEDEIEGALAHLEAAHALLARADASLLQQAADRAWIGLQGNESVLAPEAGPPVIPLANLYLAPLRILPVVRTATAETLLDLATAADLLDDDASLMLRAAARDVAEAALATACHVVTPAPALRATALLLAGRAQRELFQRHGTVGSARAARDALMTALSISYECGHDHVAMRGAALELVRLHCGPEGGGAVAPARELQLATHFLSLAALLAQQRCLLDFEAATLAAGAPAPGFRDAFSVADREDMGVHDGADIAVATAVRHLLALRRETEIPGALLDVLAIRAHAAACRIHEILREYLPAYREACCMDLDTLILADNVVPAVPEALVCVQWVAAPLEGIRSDSGIYPTVEAYVLLGVVADHAGVGRFANAPHLLKIHAITSADVSAMRRRCAKLRYALQRAGGCIPRVLRAEFDVILCDMHAILHPGSTNARALSGEPVDSTGASLDVECTADTLLLLGQFFSSELGTRISHNALCYFLRDVFEPSISA